MGNIFIVDAENNAIREVNIATGVITTVVGNGTPGFSGDGGPASAAELDHPTGVAIDSSGNIFIADAGSNLIREVSSATGKIATVAGNGTAGSSGNGGPATAAELDLPEGVAVDSSGNIFIADTGSSEVREVNAGSGVISTIAGTGMTGSGGNGGPATAADLNAPINVAIDTAGDVFIADSNNNEIREVMPPRVRSLSWRAMGRPATQETAGRRRVPSSTSQPASRSRLPGTSTSPIA